MMYQPIKHEPNPSLDLVMERIVDVPKELVWKAWTEPEMLMKWFTPAPWRTTECDIDLRPGGRFRSVMEGPAGERFDNEGCYLEVVENEKLVWTTAMGPGYRPRPSDSEFPFLFSAVITMEDFEGGTKYRALVIHGDEAAQKNHNDMGFHNGWGAAFDQLIALLKKD